MSKNDREELNNKRERERERERERIEDWKRKLEIKKYK